MREIRAVGGDPRDRLLSAAADLFSTHGYAAVSTARIATAAKASKETLYTHFGGKAGLLRAVLEHLVPSPDASEAGAEVCETPSAPHLETLLDDLAVNLVDDLTHPTYLALARIVVAETPRDPSLATTFRESVAGRALSRVATLLEAGQRTGVVDADLDPALAARALVGPLLTYVLLDGLLRPPGDVRSPSRDVVAAHVDLFIRSVRQGAPSKRGGTA